MLRLHMIMLTHGLLLTIMLTYRLLPSLLRRSLSYLLRRSLSFIYLQTRSLTQFYLLTTVFTYQPAALRSTAVFTDTYIKSL